MTTTNGQTTTYRLTLSETHLVAMVGVQRALDAIRSERQGRYGRENGAGFDDDIIGCAGELTLARHLNRFWNGAFGNLQAADVSGNFQVRASMYTGPNAGLILHPADADDQPFVKAIVRLPVVTLMGWLICSDGKQQKYWGDLQHNRPCFLIRHELLRPMSELKGAA